MGNCRKDQLSAEACACMRKFILYRIHFYPSRNLKRMANCRKYQLSVETFACKGSLHCIVFSFILQGILREWRTVRKISCLLRHLLVAEVFQYLIQFYPSRNLKRMANCRKDQLSAEACACRGSLSCIVFSFILQGILREWRTVGKISCLLRYMLVEEVYPVSYSVLSFKES